MQSRSIDPSRFMKGRLRYFREVEGLYGKISSGSNYIGSPEGFFSEKLKRDRLMRMRQVFNMLRPNWKSPRGLTVTMTVTVWEIFVLIIIMGRIR